MKVTVEYTVEIETGTSDPHAQQTLVDEVTDRINETGYVSNIHIIRATKERP